jgi:hypothetical protein
MDTQVWEHSETAASDKLAAALDYAARGLQVFPCRAGTKLPATVDGFKSATTDAAQIRAWWTRWPDANVAVATGAASGVVVLDVDIVSGGTESLERLKQENGPLPRGPQVLTGSGGTHVYFAYPELGVHNSVGQLGKGLDVRGDGGYVVAPPSLHESGNPYKWLRPLNGNLPGPPEWLLEVNEKRRKGVASVGDTIEKGERDNTLTSLAGSMRARGMGEPEILAALEVTNKTRCVPPLPGSDLRRIAGSVSRYPTREKIEQEREPFTLEVHTARTLCALPDPPATDQLLGPLVCRGQRIVLGAHTGEGKTTLALQIVRAIQNSEELFEWRGCGNVRALVIDAEQGLKTVKAASP